MLHPQPDERELDTRIADEGRIEVGLYWHPASDTIRVEAHDLSAGQGVVMRVPKCDALCAYRHPFSYAESQIVGG